ncbi:MAG: hypothetical protein IIA05_12735 [Proteobacteria bacterium]|nr:hypothetical protein [Pseudomonadota bacterium]
MAKAYIKLQPSEAVIVGAAAQIYAAYVIAGRTEQGHEAEWMEQSIREAICIAKTVDSSVQADTELD